MRKLTRRSYNRKLLVFGISIFMAVAMISTGFATWVMSSLADKEAGAPVVVGTVTDASMSIVVDQLNDEDQWTGATLSFDAPADDASGRVYAAAGSAGETLELPISGYVTNSEAMGSLTVQITLPESLQAAISANYIAIEDADHYADGVLTITFNASDLEAHSTIAGAKVFSYTLTFEWGTAFGGMNPSLYFDVDNAGKLVSDADMKDTMTAFGEALKLGMTANGDPATSYSGSIEILLSAAVRS